MKHCQEFARKGPGFGMTSNQRFLKGSERDD